MDEKEAIAHIRSTPKWYWEKDSNGEYNPNPRLIDTAQRIEDGRAKPTTIKSFFAKFGMAVEISMQVVEMEEVSQTA